MCSDRFEKAGGEPGEVPVVLYSNFEHVPDTNSERDLLLESSNTEEFPSDWPVDLVRPCPLV
jgi:hypothetical protein